jgi:3-hydroxy-5-methyl-1-naphthoate 3-O-methyltransferase
MNGPQTIWQLTSGFFMTARIVQTACELGVFDCLARAPLAADSLAGMLGTDHAGMEALLTACTAVGVLERSDSGLFRNGAAATVFLQGDGASSLKTTVVGAGRLYEAWVQLPNALKTGRPPTWIEPNQDGLRAYLAGVFSTSWPEALDFAANLDLSGVRRVLDLGGGTGAYAIALCQRWPELQVRLLDRASVAPAARAAVASAGLSDRITVQPGDYMNASFEAAYDLVLLMNVLHQELAGDAQRLVERAAGALSPRGSLAIQDICLNAHRTGPAMAALLGVNLFLQSHGCVHGVADLSGWLRKFGLETLKLDQHETTGSTTIVAHWPPPPAGLSTIPRVLRETRQGST